MTLPSSASLSDLKASPSAPTGLTFPSLSVPTEVHSEKAYDAANALIATLRIQAEQWENQVVLAEAVRLFEDHPWIAALRLNTDGTRDGIVSGVSLKTFNPATTGMDVPDQDIRSKVKQVADEVFSNIGPSEDDHVFDFADQWFSRATYLVDMGKALGLEASLDLEGFAARCRVVQTAENNSGAADDENV